MLLIEDALRYSVPFVEAEARASGLAGEDYHALRLALRQARSVSPMAKLKTRLDEELRKHRPKSPFGKAIAYALSQWSSLQIYLEDGGASVLITSRSHIARAAALAPEA